MLRAPRATRSGICPCEDRSTSSASWVRTDRSRRAGRPREVRRRRGILFRTATSLGLRARLRAARIPTDCRGMSFLRPSSADLLPTSARRQSVRRGPRCSAVVNVPPRGVGSRRSTRCWNYAKSRASRPAADRGCARRFPQHASATVRAFGRPSRTARPGSRAGAWCPRSARRIAVKYHEEYRPLLSGRDHPQARIAAVERCQHREKETRRARSRRSRASSGDHALDQGCRPRIPRRRRTRPRPADDAHSAKGLEFPRGYLVVRGARPPARALVCQEDSGRGGAPPDVRRHHTARRHLTIKAHCA